MYTKESLSIYPFFKYKLKGNELSVMLDSLTGLVTRPVMIEFIHEMIELKVPFTLAMIDLDNFKSINDNYGHKSGDEVLARVASDLMNFVGDSGVVGRFGGDEFLLINFKYLTYEAVHEFYENMNCNEAVFRKILMLNECRPFISATIGSATYPTDATTYDEMFALIDKTLYRGKSKGRNCYIIYVERLHKNLTVQKLAKHSMVSTMQILAKAFDDGSDLANKLFRVNQPFCAELRVTECYYIDIAGDMRRFSDFKLVANVDDITTFMTENEYHSDDFEDIKAVSPKTYDALLRLKMETVMITRIYRKDTSYGYLLCPGEYIRRLWQDDEQALAYFITRLMAEYLSKE